MARFHDLEVTDIRRETPDSVVIALQPSQADAKFFEFTQGQYLTFRQVIGGEEIRRSYSICSARGEPQMRVGIKRVEGGAFSSWANEHLAVGDSLETMPPMGEFHVPLEPELGKSYLGIAAGSGITPLMSLIQTTLAEEPESFFTLVYGNRTIQSIMFRDEIENIKNRYMDRFRVLHVLGGNIQDVDILSGRIDAEKCQLLFNSVIGVDNLDTAFVCGPELMMTTVADVLQQHGMAKANIKYELFTAAQSGRAPLSARPVSANNARLAASVAITLDGTTQDIQMHDAQQSVLEAALAAQIDAPFACKAGVCSACRIRVLEGEFEMRVNHALDDDELERGYALACQCYPITEKLVLSFDE